MLAAINSYCSQEATGGNPTTIQGIKYEAHQTVPESQTGQIDERFRKSCKDDNEPLSHLADNHDGLSGYECRMLQHFVFRYARRTAKPPVELVLVDHRPGTLKNASKSFFTNYACRSYTTRGQWRLK